MSVSHIRLAAVAAPEQAPDPAAEQGQVHAAGVIASSVYAHGVRVADIPVEEAGEWARKDDHVVWIGLFLVIYVLK